MLQAFRTSALLAAFAFAAAPALAQAPTPPAPVAAAQGMTDMATAADYDAAARGLSVTREFMRVTIAPAAGMTDMATSASTRGNTVTTTRPTGGTPTQAGNSGMATDSRGR